MDGQMESLLLYFFNKKMLLKMSSVKIFLGLGKMSKKKNMREGAGEFFQRESMPFPSSSLPVANDHTATIR